MSEETIFSEATQRADPAERAAFLEAACGGDKGLRRRVEALLSAHETGGSFLEPLVTPPPAPGVGEAPLPTGAGPAAEKAVDVSLSATEADTSAAGAIPTGRTATVPFDTPSRPRSHPTREDEFGAVVGPYKLLEPIGEGGMGTVYMAEQTAPVKRMVALKVIKAGMDSRQVLARFDAERQALALMDHPNIAKVLDAGATERGRSYFVMELVKGVPITQFCDERRLTPRERLELFLPVCQAVQHAHQKGIIHRDLKPTNVLVGLYDGKPVPKIIDFGLAKAMSQKLTEQTLFTGFGTVVGTPEYMSPEQAQLDNIDIDTRSDIYSLGILLYELLTGTTPLQHKRMKHASVLEMLRLVREEEPPRPSRRLSTTEELPSIAANRNMEPRKLTGLVHGDLDWIVMKALDKDRNRRYETASAFAADIERYTRDEPVQARPPSTWYRVRKLIRRHQGKMLAGSLLALTLLAGIIGTTWGMLRATQAQGKAIAEARQKDSALRAEQVALAAARRSKREADEKLFGSYRDQARANRLSRRPGQRFESLDVLRKATELARTLGLPDDEFLALRNDVIATLALPDLQLAGPSNPWPADGFSADYDEAHALYARTDRQGNCSVRRVADDAELHHLPGIGLVAWPVLSRDGRFLAVMHRTEGTQGLGVALHFWDLKATPARRIGSEEMARSVDFHPNGQQVAMAHEDGAIRVFELPSGRQLYHLPPVDLTREVKIALHPTKPLAAFSSYFHPAVQLRNLRSGEVIARLPQDANPGGVAWHPDGRTLAVSLVEARRIRLYDRETLEVFRTLEADEFVGPLAFNHAGDRLASFSWDSQIELFDVGTGQKLFAMGRPSLGIRFRLDGRGLAGAVLNGKLGIYQVADGRECRSLVRKGIPERVGFHYPFSVNPDGRLLAAAMSDGFGLWDLASGCQLAFVPTEWSTNQVLFEPSGALLVLCSAGLMRWPIRGGSDDAGPLVMGPPERMPLPPGHALGQSRDGRVIVTCSRAVAIQQEFAGGWILHAGRPDQPIRIDPGADLLGITISPDGNWVVTFAHSPQGVIKAWNARTGELVKHLADRSTAVPAFSPDGRWLSTDLDGGRLVEAGTWERGPQVGGAGTFAPDGRSMAIGNGEGGVRLVDLATGRELATLEDPSYSTGGHVFSPDGGLLIGRAGGEFKSLRVWDLRLVRRHLAEMGLDWDAPPYAPGDPARTAVAPLKVEVRLGDPVQPTRTLEEKSRYAIAKYKRMLEGNPEDARVCNALAWTYLTAPEAFRNVKAAVPLAEKAVQRDPASGIYGNTLGVAYYRAGRYREAAEILHTNIDRQADWALAFDLYFLAMSHYRLGETKRAKEYYDWAVRWTRTCKGLAPEHIEDLEMFRSEAVELLGVAGKAGVEVAPP